MCQVDNEQQKPKRKTYTSNAVKDRWNRKHYQVFSARLKPGLFDQIKDYQEREQLSRAQFLEKAINELEKKEKD